MTLTKVASVGSTVVLVLCAITVTGVTVRRELRPRAPLPLAIHRFAQPAAQASECAAEQGRFEAMHDVLFQQQRAIGVRAWKDIAEEVGVPDVARFERCVAGPPKASIARDVAVANTLDGSGTPMVLVNGLRFAGTIPQDRLDSLIRKSLARPE